MNGRLLLVISGLIALTPQGQAGAQSSQPPAQDITVIGERPDDEDEARREAGAFVRSQAVETRIGQLARWHEPVCVRTWGLPLELNARISNRIMDVAERIGVATDRSDLCRPNVRIGFTTEAQAMIRQAEDRNRHIIGFHYARQRDRLMRVRQPVQAWYVTTTRAPSGEEQIDEAGLRTLGGAAGSRLSSDLSAGLAHVLIFADARIAAGQEVDSIADLFAYLALAQTPVAEQCAEVATILNLMNPACAPNERPARLTRQDLAYLNALYRTDPRLGPALQRGEVVLHMARELEGR